MVEATTINGVAAPARPSVEQIWAWLREVTDPEIPVISVVELGIVRDVLWSEEDGTCIVTITPTYSGCPAIAVIQAHIREELEKQGIACVHLRTQLSPAWTTDWLSPQGREALRKFAIAPPVGRASGPTTAGLPVLDTLVAQPAPACPHCGSTRTTSISQFGSTLCKALYRCEECLEPFDYFKCH